MNPATQAMDGHAPAPVFYLALESNNRSWRLAFGDGAKQRQVSAPAADRAVLAGAVAKAKVRARNGQAELAGAQGGTRGSLHEQDAHPLVRAA